MAIQGKSYLNIINEVLQRLREATVASNGATAYSTLIGKTVNQVKEEIEDAWYWYALRDTYSVTAVPNTTNYILTSAGMNAVILDGWNTTTPQQLKRATNADFNLKFFGSGILQTGIVVEFLPAGFNSSNDLAVDIWPNPSSTQALKFNVYRPQAELTADADIPLVPQRVLVEGTMARVLRERGEDGGTGADRQEATYRELLASSISREAGHDSEELLWEPE